MKKMWTMFSSVAACLFVSHLAFADDPTKQQCVDANTQAQSLRTDGKFASATAQSRICANPACPQLVRDDCTQRLDQIIQLQATIDFSVRDQTGQELADVAVDVDGTRLTDRLTGNAMPVDAGDHAFMFTSPGHAPLTKHFLIHASEQNRRESIVLAAAAAPVTPPAATNAASPDETPPPPAQESKPGKTQRIIGVAVAGVGVVGVAVGAIFGLSASSSWSSSQSECSSSSCPNHAQAVSDHDSAVSTGTISTIGFIAGGVFLAGGAVLYLTAPKASSAAPTVGLSPSLGGAVLRGTF